MNQMKHADHTAIPTSRLTR